MYDLNNLGMFGAVILRNIGCT